MTEITGAIILFSLIGLAALCFTVLLIISCCGKDRHNPDANHKIMLEDE